MYLLLVWLFLDLMITIVLFGAGHYVWGTVAAIPLILFAALIAYREFVGFKPANGRKRSLYPSDAPSLLWKCPTCRALLHKGLDMGASPARVIGTATCGKCGAKFSQADVYGGKYDPI